MSDAGVDVLVVTAVKDEFDAVMEVDTGAVDGSRWVVEATSANLEIAFRSFVGSDGSILRLAVTRTVEMGGVAVADAASPLVEFHRPRALAMCGVCAGRRGSVNLGDVIIADRLWFYDTGKLKVDEDGVSRIWGDPHQYKLRSAWMHPAERFSPAASEGWLRTRPRTYEQQEQWLLDRLSTEEDPKAHADQDVACRDYNLILARLEKADLIERGPLHLTAAGRAEVLRRADLVRLLDPAFKVHLGPIGSGSCVVEDEKIFDRLALAMRKVIGLEMEAAAIGAIAHHREIPSIVMKGVQDFADPKKNDNFRAFAARASAECLLAFLRAHLPPNASNRGGGIVDTTERERHTGQVSSPPGPRSVFLRRRCRVITGGSSPFRRVIRRLLTEKHDVDILRDMREKTSRLESSFERTVALAAIQECDGRIEEMAATLQAVSFLGEEECCRRLLLGIALEKLDQLGGAIAENDWILLNANTNTLFVAAQFNSHVCREKGGDFAAVDFGRFVTRTNVVFPTGEKLWHKALSMDLITCSRSGRRSEHEHLVDQALKDEVVSCPTGYVKTLLNWAGYRGMHLETPVLDEITGLMKHLATNARTAAMFRVAQSLRLVGDEDGAVRLLGVVRHCADSSRSETVRRLV